MGLHKTGLNSKIIYDIGVMKSFNIKFDSSFENSTDLCKYKLGLIINPDGAT